MLYHRKEGVYVYIMERRLPGHFPKVWRQIPSWLQPSCSIGSAHAAVLGCSFLVILCLHSPLSMVWVSKLHLSLRNMEWELHMEQKLNPTGKAS